MSSLWAPSGTESSANSPLRNCPSWVPSKEIVALVKLAPTERRAGRGTNVSATGAGALLPTVAVVELAR